MGVLINPKSFAPHLLALVLQQTNNKKKSAKALLRKGAHKIVTTTRIILIKTKYNSVIHVTCLLYHIPPYSSIMPEKDSFVQSILVTSY